MPDFAFSSNRDVLPPEKVLNDERLAGLGCACILRSDATRSVGVCTIDQLTPLCDEGEDLIDVTYVNRAKLVWVKGHEVDDWATNFIEQRLRPWKYTSTSPEPPELSPRPTRCCKL